MSTSANWSGVFKRRYGKFINPLPSDNTIAEFADFVQKDARPGENYNFPVKLGNEHGVTHNTDNTAFTLSSTVDSVTKNAQLTGATIMLAGNIPYDVIAMAMNGASDGGGQGGAYFESIDFKVKNLMESGELYRELALLYGPGTASAAAANLGAVSASISGANLGAPQVVNITRATWAAGIWNQMINGVVDIYQSDGSTLRASEVTVQAVVPATNRLQLFKDGSTATVATGDVIVPRGSRTKSCYGLQAILENTGSLFGIDAAVYPQWKAISYSAGTATLTRAKILQMASRLYPNGLRKGGKLFVNGMTFADLAEEADALQRYTENTAAVKRQGSEGLLYKSPVGDIEVVVHSLMKQSLAFFVAKGVMKRVGTTDLTFGLPGTNKWFYVELPSNAGSQLRIFSNQAPVLEIPYHCAIVTAIQNNGDTSPA